MMPKRLIDSNLFNKDWFLELPVKMKTTWMYMILHCNHGGIFDPNLKVLSFLLALK